MGDLNEEAFYIKKERFEIYIDNFLLQILFKYYDINLIIIIYRQFVCLLFETTSYGTEMQRENGEIPGRIQ